MKGMLLVAALVVALVVLAGLSGTFTFTPAPTMGLVLAQAVLYLVWSVLRSSRTKRSRTKSFSK